MGGDFWRQRESCELLVKTDSSVILCRRRKIAEEIMWAGSLMGSFFMLYPGSGRPSNREKLKMKKMI
jgi:hypothetical protein